MKRVVAQTNSIHVLEEVKMGRDRNLGKTNAKRIIEKIKKQQEHNKPRIRHASEACKNIHKDIECINSAQINQFTYKNIEKKKKARKEKTLSIELKEELETLVNNYADFNIYSRLESVDDHEVINSSHANKVADENKLIEEKYIENLKIQAQFLNNVNLIIWIFYLLLDFKLTSEKTTKTMAASVISMDTHETTNKSVLNSNKRKIAEVEERLEHGGSNANTNTNESPENTNKKTMLNTQTNKNNRNKYKFRKNKVIDEKPINTVMFKLKDQEARALELEENLTDSVSKTQH